MRVRHVRSGMCQSHLLHLELAYRDTAEVPSLVCTISIPAKLTKKSAVQSVVEAQQAY